MYLTAKETSDKLGVDVSTLWRWDKSGYLKKIKVGNAIRYRLSDVNKLMEG
ncbi:DNA-binding protein [Parabacteroides distasonis]|nr:DNA-binding protein [Parabacteroides distasonis]